MSAKKAWASGRWRSKKAYVNSDLPAAGGRAQQLAGHAGRAAQQRAARARRHAGHARAQAAAGRGRLWQAAQRPAVQQQGRRRDLPSASLYLRCARSYSPPRVLNVDMPAGCSTAQRTCQLGAGRGGENAATAAAAASGGRWGAKPSRGYPAAGNAHPRRPTGQSPRRRRCAGWRPPPPAAAPAPPRPRRRCRGSVGGCGRAVAVAGWAVAAAAAGLARAWRACCRIR